MQAAPRGPPAPAGPQVALRTFTTIGLRRASPTVCGGAHGIGLRAAAVAGLAGAAAGATRVQRPGGRGQRRSRLRRGAGAAAVQPGDTVAVIGAGGNVGRLVTQRLCELGDCKVRGVLRDPAKARAGWAGGLENCELFGADVRDYAALEAALAGANSVVCCTGVPAFGFSGQWEKGNHPESVDHYGVKNAVHSWAAGASGGVAKRRFVLMSSVGVQRRDGFPYSVLNGGGVLDAKASGEAALLALAEERGFATAIVRPGQLFGGPYENNRYLGTLFQLDKEVDTKSVSLVPGDTAVGDTLRSSLAGVLVRCLFAEAPRLEFAAVSEKGAAPTEEDVDEMISRLGSAPDGDVDEQAGKRLDLGLKTAQEALKNLASGKVFGQSD